MTKQIEHIIQNRNIEEISLIEIIPHFDAPKAVIQFHSGTVIKKEFYLKFANFLAVAGYAVILFDYRGVGESRSNNLRGNEASISSWGIVDAPSVTEWIENKYPTLKIHLVAHSMGGQILGLMDNWSIFDKVILLASSSGNWNNFTPSMRRKVRLSTSLFFPICLRLFGYVPGRFGLGQDWPKGVAQEWWLNSKNDHLMVESMNQEHTTTEYTKINKDIHALFFSDDPMATPRTNPNIAKTYPAAKVLTQLIKPEDFGLKEIGHFGIFKSYNQTTLGSLVTDLLAN